MEFAIVTLMSLLTLGACSILPPCSSVFYYELDENTGITYGIVKILPKINVLEMNLEVTMRFPYIPLPEHNTRMKLLEQGDEIIATTKSGNPLHFRISFPQQIRFPEFVRAKMNGFDICRGKEVSRQQYQDVIYEYKLTASEPFLSEEDSEKLASQVIIHPKGVIKSTCGKPKSINPVDQRHSAFDITSPAQWPWLVTILSTSDFGEPLYICTGTLISRKSVLTTASCIPPTQGSDPELVVFLGISNPNDRTTPGSVRKSVREVRIHPDHNDHSIDGAANIAILILREPVEQSPSIQPVCLMDKSMRSHEKYGYLAGWGIQLHTFHSPTMVRVPIVPSSMCSLVYYDDINGMSKSFCGGRSDGVGACHVDQGSGLVFRSSNTYFLRGIAVHMRNGIGRHTCVKPQYIIFADVTQFSDWIVSTME